MGNPEYDTSEYHQKLEDNKNRRKRQRKIALLAKRKAWATPFIKSLQRQLREAKDETGIMKQRFWNEQCQKVSWKEKHGKMQVFKEFFEKEAMKNKKAKEAQEKKNEAMLKVNVKLAEEKRTLTKQLEKGEAKNEKLEDQKKKVQKKLSDLELKAAWVSVKIGGKRKFDQLAARPPRRLAQEDLQ